MNPGKTQRSALLWLVPALVLLAIFLFSRPRGNPSSPAIGKPGPELDLVKLSDDMRLTPLDELRGGVVLLHFWGTWCPPCRMEYPELVEMTKTFESRPEFHFIPVSCESGPEPLIELWDKTSHYFAEANVTSDAYADPRWVTRRSVAERLGQQSLYFPTSILIGPDGEIAGVWEGYLPEGVEQMKQEITRLLGS